MVAGAPRPNPLAAVDAATKPNCEGPVLGPNENEDVDGCDADPKPRDWLPPLPSMRVKNCDTDLPLIGFIHGSFSLKSARRSSLWSRRSVMMSCRT